jgi:flagellar hook protein FlgE
MSLFGSLYSSVSGLSAQSKSMSMISDNVANVNTTAYKGAVADFASLVTRRPSSQAYSPGGVRAFTSYDVEQQGLIQSSSSPTDVAISGNGFFVVNRTSGADGLPGEQLYTRAGSFEPDFLGNLRTPTGFYLQGWALDADENITDINQLETVNTRTIQGVAAATTQVDLGANLDADAAHINDGTYVASGAGTNNMSQYLAGQLQDPPVLAGMQPTFSRDVQIYDSLGRPRTVTVAFLREDPTVTANQWHVEVFADPTSLDAVHADGLLATGTVNFRDDGSLDDPDVLVPFPGGGPAGRSFTVDWIDSNGAADSLVTLRLGAAGTTTGLTQFSSPSDVAFVTQNGAEVGELNGVRIDEEGHVVASFTNGEERKLYQLPIATFPNPGALDPRSGNVYQQTDVAGEFNLRFAGVGGAGTVTPSSLEAANVDIAEEFTKMIVTQRAYSASSKIISTADQLLEELLRITR